MRVFNVWRFHSFPVNSNSFNNSVCLISFLYFGNDNVRKRYAAALLYTEIYMGKMFVEAVAVFLFESGHGVLYAANAIYRIVPTVNAAFSLSQMYNSIFLLTCSFSLSFSNTAMFSSLLSGLMVYYMLPMPFIGLVYREVIRNIFPSSPSKHFHYYPLIHVPAAFLFQLYPPAGNI